MAGYLSERIKKNKLNYNDVVAKYPAYKEDIDFILACDNYTVNADGTVTKAAQ